MKRVFPHVLFNGMWLNDRRFDKFLIALAAVLIICLAAPQALANYTFTYQGAPFDLAKCPSYDTCISGSIGFQIEFSGEIPSTSSWNPSPLAIVSAIETLNGATYNYPINNMTINVQDGVVTTSEADADYFGCTGSLDFHTETGSYDLFYDDCAPLTSQEYGRSDNQGQWSFSGAAPNKALGKCSCGDAGAGDPISVASGNMFEQVSDYTTAGTNRLAFIRSYNALSGSQNSATDLGSNWRSNYDRYLSIYSTSSQETATVERPDGRLVSFTQQGGAWVGDTDVDVKLVSSGNNWTLTDYDDTVETYVPNSVGVLQLTSITARGGYKQNLTYNAAGQLSKVTDTYGRTLTFTYTGALLTSVLTPDNTTLAYGYTASGGTGTPLNRLASVTYSTSPATSQTYVYENTSFPFALTGIIDENGNRFTTWTYDTQERATSSQHAGGADLTQLTYNADGSTTVQNALGEQDVYKFTTLHGIPKITEIDRLASATTPAATRLFTYDTNGYLASKTDWKGNLTNYTNDYRGLPLTVVEAVNTSIARTTQTTWSVNFHVPTSVDTSGLTQHFTYDSKGNRISRTDVATGVSRTWTYGWTNALLTSIAGPRTDVQQTTLFSYGSLGRLISIKNALGQVTSIPLSTIGGRPAKVVDPNGVTSNFAYDPRQRLVASAVVTAAGTRITRVTYDAAGNLTNTLLPDGSFLTNSYDPAHRLVATADPLGDMVTYTLDGLGDRSATIIGKSGITTWQDAGSFDALGRNTLDMRGAGEKIRTTYDADGQILTTTDSLSHTTRRVLDALERTNLLYDAANERTTSLYDQHDRIIKIIAPNLATTTYTYDGLGRLLKRVSADTGTTSYTFDLADNLIRSVDASGVISTHTYDALNRVLSTSYPADPSESVTFTYDQSGHGFGVSHLTSVADAAGAVSFTYDERGNELGETRTSGSLSLTTLYSYDAASRVASITYPSGTVANHVHDKAGRVTAISAKKPGATSPVPVVSAVSYAPFGPITGMTYGNGVAESRVYDQSHRLGKLATGGVQFLTYGYDLADNVTAIADHIQTGNSQKFGYDSVYHLNAATGAYGTFAWTYDAAGNRLTETAQSGATQFSYQPNSNVLATVTSGGVATQVTTSPAGNILALTSPSSATDLLFNKAERLASVEIGTSQVAAYTYDAFGRRFSKTLAGGGSLFQYNPSGALLEETDGAGNLKTDTIYLSGVPVADVTSNAVFFLHTDRLGTPQLATTTTKAVAWQAAYQPFGFNTGASGLFTQNLRFPGQYADAETGFYQNGFRDYNPALGRYLEADPIGLRGGVNTYLYAGANPTRYIDRYGKSWLPSLPPAAKDFLKDELSEKVFDETLAVNGGYLLPDSIQDLAPDIAWFILTNATPSSIIYNVFYDVFTPTPLDVGEQQILDQLMAKAPNDVAYGKCNDIGQAQ